MENIFMIESFKSSSTELSGSLFLGKFIEEKSFCRVKVKSLNLKFWNSLNFELFKNLNFFEYRTVYSEFGS